MRTALRTALATALVAGVAATPVLTAGSAFAAGTAPAPAAAASAPAKAAAPAPAKTAAPAPAKTAAPAPAKGAASAGAAAPATTAPATEAPAPAAETAETAPDADALVRTVELDGGLTAKVYDKGTQHRYFTATVLRGTNVLGELKAGGGYGASDTGIFSGYAVTLDAEGKVTAVEAGPEHATLVRTEKLIGGRTAKIYKLKDLDHFAELFLGGRKVGELHSAGRPVADWDPSTEYFVLNPDGTTHNWTGTTADLKAGFYRLVDGTILEARFNGTAIGLQTVDPATGKGSGFTYPYTGGRKILFYGKAVVVLESTGHFAAYVPGAARQSAPQPYDMETGKVDNCLPQRIDLAVGAGTVAELTMTTKGPKAKLVTAGDDKVIAVLDRAHPSLPANAGIVARIDGAYTATPTLYAKLEGGEAKGGTYAFPSLPKGCSVEGLASAGQAQNTGTGNGNGTSNGAQAQGGQTSVVPRGGVAAGVEPAAEEDSGMLVAAGAGAAALTAAGLGFLAMRRRTATVRG
ncbi:hypothetical protein ACFZCF_08890 [Streptomyces sp. NPDC007945]|uniref:hypothetical protein n=1 Tax=Streptomyces sp. NPDC007945 TaxID=3364797 RepID=UPI0036EF8644